jgi:hypothetical protein
MYWPARKATRVPIGKRRCRRTTPGAIRCLRNTRAVTSRGWPAAGSRDTRRGETVRSDRGRALQNSASKGSPAAAERTLPPSATDPARTLPWQVMQTPRRQEYGMSSPARWAASSTLSSGPQGKLRSLCATRTVHSIAGLQRQG